MSVLAKRSIATKTLAGPKPSSARLGSRHTIGVFRGWGRFHPPPFLLASKEQPPQSGAGLRRGSGLPRQPRRGAKVRDNHETRDQACGQHHHVYPCADAAAARRARPHRVLHLFRAAPETHEHILRGLVVVRTAAAVAAQQLPRGVGRGAADGPEEQGGRPRRGRGAPRRRGGRRGGQRERGGS